MDSETKSPLKTIVDNPALLEEWNYEKNNGSKPEEYSLGSNAKVWWKCRKGHEWESTVNNRTRGKGCPYCSGRKAWSGENDLLTLFPSIAKEWNNQKNGDLSPSQIRPGSNKKVWWECEKGHEWEDSPNHRVQGRGCPYCSHHRVLPETSLSSLFPEILDEWDYDQNTVPPEQYGAFSNQTVYWKCKKCGQTWKAPIANRTNLKSGCPICSNRVVLPKVNDLQTINPLLAAEWDPEKNDLSPNMVSAGSNEKVWWKCSYGHSWRAAISTRNKGVGCPECKKYLRTSIQEHAVYYYVHKFFPDAIRAYTSKYLGRKELDIYVPSKNVGIEYDGQHWHNSVEKDVQKDELCASIGINLVRIREPKCPQYPRSMPTVILDDLSTSSLKSATESVLKLLSGTTINVSIKDDYDEILETYRKNYIESNFAVKYPEIARQWDPKLNGELRPEFFPGTGSKTKVFWQCPVCKSSWKASFDSRIRGSGCPVCAGRIVMKGVNDLQTNNPSLASEWHPTKNGELSPEDVTTHSHKKVWWICNRGHEWESAVKDRAVGNGCPFCSGRKVLKGFNDLATISPKLAEEWDLERNDRKPEEITANSRYMAHWICKECGHSWSAYVYSRSRGNGCPQCAAKHKRSRKK